MIYLNEGSFKPSLILISIIVLPTSIASWILTFVDFRIELFIVSFLMLGCYFLFVWGIYKHSKTKKYYLFVEDKAVVINYPNLNCFKVDMHDIIKIEYYKILSIRAWCMIFNCVFPQCAYITYLKNGKEICNHIGYPKFDKISKLCMDMGIELVVK